MVGSLFEIISPITVYSTSSRKQKQFTYRDILSSGVFLLIGENVPYIDWTTDFSSMLINAAKNNGLHYVGSGNGHPSSWTYSIVQEEGKPRIEPADLFLPITWCNEILLVDKYFELSTESFNDYLKSGSIYMHEKKKCFRRVY